MIEQMKHWSVVDWISAMALLVVIIGIFIAVPMIPFFLSCTAIFIFAVRGIEVIFRENKEKHNE
jgi:hypothetical protein